MQVIRVIPLRGKATAAGFLNGQMRNVWNSCSSHIRLGRHSEYDGGCKFGSIAYGWLADPKSCHTYHGCEHGDNFCDLINCDYSAQKKNSYNWDLVNDGPGMWLSRGTTCTYVNV